jgi:hypothetical protein
MSKLKDLKEQHPSLAISILDVLRKIDPSDTGKYMHFLIKALYEGGGGKESIESALESAISKMFGKEQISVLTKFENYSKTHVIKEDITQVKTFSDMKAIVTEVEENEKLKQMEKQVHKWYMDDDWIVVTPVTFEASKMYGRGTKWCTTNEMSWQNYKNGLLVYFINRKLKTKAKWAAYINDTKMEYYDEMDNRVSDSILLPFSNEVRNVLIHIYNNFKNHSCERAWKHHSTNHILHKNGNYYEIALMKKPMLESEIARYEAMPEDANDKVRIANMKERLKTAIDESEVDKSKKTADFLKKNDWRRNTSDRIKSINTTSKDYSEDGEWKYTEKAIEEVLEKTIQKKIANMDDYYIHIGRMLSEM